MFFWSLEKIIYLSFWGTDLYHIRYDISGYFIEGFNSVYKESAVVERK